jgi:hypothetical protein
VISIYKCPQCGREYSARACKPLIPDHVYIETHPSRMSAQALEAGAASEFVKCPGSGQVPRNAASDGRPLWKDEVGK